MVYLICSLQLGPLEDSFKIEILSRFCYLVCEVFLGHLMNLYHFVTCLVILY